VPRTTDPERIRRILEADRPWSAYALGDLQPALFAQCAWYAPENDDPALALHYRGFSTPVLFTIGQPEALRPLLAETTEPETYLSVRPEVLPLVEEDHAVRDLSGMWRMVLDPPALMPPPVPVRRLAVEDVSAVGALLEDGRASGETPDFFRLTMVRDGVFFGVYEGIELIAMAGTHVVSPEEGAAAVGNVYTRRDRRGRGLAGAVTAAVSRELLRLGCSTVVLNVEQRNAPAVRAYERVGFRRYCPFYEGLAVRVA
jgi:ribosomal protein S18 acetylase RimI-like enzyme